MAPASSLSESALAELKPETTAVSETKSSVRTGAMEAAGTRRFAGLQGFVSRKKKQARR